MLFSNSIEREHVLSKLPWYVQQHAKTLIDSYSSVLDKTEQAFSALDWTFHIESVAKHTKTTYFAEMLPLACISNESELRNTAIYEDKITIMS